MGHGSAEKTAPLSSERNRDLDLFPSFYKQTAQEQTFDSLDIRSVMVLVVDLALERGIPRLRQYPRLGDAGIRTDGGEQIVGSRHLPLAIVGQDRVVEAGIQIPHRPQLPRVETRVAQNWKRGQGIRTCSRV